MITISFNAAEAQILGADKKLHDYLHQNLVWIDKKITYKNYQNRNNSWYKAQNDIKYCYNVRTGKFPTGLLKKAYHLLKTRGVECTFERTYNIPQPVDAQYPEWAYEHQIRAAELAIKHKRGLIQSPTGSGKTLMGAFIISRYPNARALIMVPRVNLLNNVHRTLEDYLKEPVGRVGDSKADWQRVTVGIAKSLTIHANGDFKDLLAKQDILIGDEAHHYGAPEVQKVGLAANNTFMRIGLSATLGRTDGSDTVLEGMFGPKFLEIREEEMIKIGVTHAPIVKFLRVPGKIPSLDTTRIQEGALWNVAYEVGIVNNEERNKLVCRLAHKYLSQEGKKGAALILIKLKKHGLALQSMLENMGSNALYIDGDVKGNLRQKVLDAYRKGGEGGIDCLISTCILDEGEDVARLELVINAAGGPGERQVIQRIGRGQRLDKTGNKDRCIFIDFVDHLDLNSTSDILNNHTYKRIEHIENRYYGRVEIINEKKAEEVLLKAE